MRRSSSHARRRDPSRLISSALALGLLLPSVARANGAYTHVHISQLAADALPPGELAALLAVPENRAALEAGSMFPDSGYAVGDEYGELAHWEPFLSAFIAHLSSTYGGDYSSVEAEREVAFLLGVASHGLADQTYDTTLLARAFEIDGPENAEHPVDQYADYFIVIDERVVFSVDAWAPYAAIIPVVAAVGHTVSEATLTTGVSRMSVVTEVQSNPRVAGAAYWDAWADYPFLGTHVYNPVAVGSLPWVAERISAYWEVLWDRLHGSDDVDAQLVIHTEPDDGGVNWPVDLSVSEAWSRPAIWFGYGIERDQIAPLITLREAATGSAVPITLRTAYNGRQRNLVFLHPEVTLAHDTDYTVEIAPGVETLDGRTSAAAFMLSFRTRCAEDRLADCPPLDPPLVAGPTPTPPTPADAGAATPDAGPGPSTSGGCAAAPHRSEPWIGWTLIALLLTRRRRCG